MLVSIRFSQELDLRSIDTVSVKLGHPNSDVLARLRIYYRCIFGDTIKPIELEGISDLTRYALKSGLFAGISDDSASVPVIDNFVTLIIFEFMMKRDRSYTDSLLNQEVLITPEKQ